MEITDFNTKEWSFSKKILFRITFLYALFFCLPIHSSLYKYLIKMDWANINCRDFFVVATYRHPDLIELNSESFHWGLLGYINFILPLLIAIPLAFLWSALDKKRKNYNQLSYWLEVVIRYRVGLGMVAWGYRKLMPSQMVLPTNAILDTSFGDFQAQKLYWQAVGIVPPYEVFLGFAEFIPGILLLFRKTATAGALLAGVVMVNVALANHAYDGSVHIHSAAYAILCIILLWPNLTKLWILLVQQKDVVIERYYPDFKQLWFRNTRLVLKSFIFATFVIWFFILQVEDYQITPYRLPQTPGVTELKGYYDVKEFKINDQILPYNPLDSVRWQKAIFEDWRTLSFTVNKPTVIDRSNGGGFSKKDEERKWEVAGIGGGKRWFHYTADTLNKVLKLHNKNDFFCGNNNSVNHKEQYNSKLAEDSQGEACTEKLTLHYAIKYNQEVTLSGTNQNNEKIAIVLTKKHINYPLLESSNSKISAF
jgi:hypothetical protein